MIARRGPARFTVGIEGHRPARRPWRRRARRRARGWPPAYRQGRRQAPAVATRASGGI